MQKLNRDGVALAYEDLGSGAPAILFVHCWTGNHSFFQPQIEHFSAGHRVVAVDLRGHGESDKPATGYAVADFVEDLVWLCGQLGVQRPVVVGHSMGGNIALDLAASHPDFASAIVLLDSCILPSPEFIEALTGVSSALKAPGYQDAIRNLMESVCLPTDDKALTTPLIDVMASAPQHVASPAFDGHLLSWDGRTAAANCKVPALYVGAAMPLANLLQFRELCPQLVEGRVVGSGHLLLQEVPDQVNGMIDQFLKVALG